MPWELVFAFFVGSCVNYKVVGVFFVLLLQCAIGRVFLQGFPGQAQLFLTYYLPGLLVSRHNPVLKSGLCVCDGLCRLQSVWGKGGMGRRFASQL